MSSHFVCYSFDFSNCQLRNILLLFHIFVSLQSLREGYVFVIKEDSQTIFFFADDLQCQMQPTTYLLNDGKKALSPQIGILI